MVKLVLKDQIVFGESPLGVSVLSGRDYWDKIVFNKHPEANLTIEQVSNTIINPDKVFISKVSSNVFLYTRKTSSRTTVVTVKHVGKNQGIILTVYKTTDKKINKEVIWQK